MAIRVLIAGPTAELSSAYWRKALARAADIEIVGEAGAPDELASIAARLEPRVALVDARLHRDGRSPAATVTTASPSTAVLLITGDPTAAPEEAVLGRISRVARPSELLDAVRAVARGEAWPPAAQAGPSIPRGRKRAVMAALSDKELAVLAGVARGLTNRQIARDLAYSESTVKNRLSVIFTKIGVQDRTQAAIYAVKNGLVTPDQPAADD